MSITDKLRSWGKGKFADGLFNDVYEELLPIADRIDEAHKKAVMGAMNDALYYANDENMAELGWLRLPKDADGKVIHVEDEVELLDGSERFNAEWLEWDGEGWAVHSTEGYGAWHMPNHLRHIEPDSWERIIEDAISECGWEQPKEYEIDFEDSRETRDRFVAELVERCKRLAGE